MPDVLLHRTILGKAEPLKRESHAISVYTNEILFLLQWRIKKPLNSFWNANTSSPVQLLQFRTRRESSCILLSYLNQINELLGTIRGLVDYLTTQHFELLLLWLFFTLVLCGKGQALAETTWPVIKRTICLQANFNQSDEQWKRDTTSRASW